MRMHIAFAGAVLAALVPSAHAAPPAEPRTELDALRQEIETLRSEYERRIEALERRLQAAEAPPAPAVSTPPPVDTGPVAASVSDRARGFNPDISLILDGKLSSFSRDPEDYRLDGFQTGGEAGPGEEGFSVAHSELMMSANVDDLFFGQLTAAIATHDGATEIELEEAYVETPGLGHGLMLRAGRFYSGIGYLNQQHAHAWDFADAPLVYRALFGDQLNDDGLQLAWLAPTDLYLTLGAEWLRGGDFPAAGASHGGLGAGSVFAKLGGDVGPSHSWQLGLSHWRADVTDRTGGGHAHEGAGEADVSFSGDSRISALDAVWKWAPDGNPTRTYLKLQGEYFLRDENGTVAIAHDPVEETWYLGEQRGWYAQAVYQFMPRWRAGLRYDRLTADNTGSDAEVLAEAGLDGGLHDPERYALMVDYSRSEFSRLRLQYNRDRSRPVTDHQWYLQYIMSLGAHGAHAY